MKEFKYSMYMSMFKRVRIVYAGKMTDATFMPRWWWMPEHHSLRQTGDDEIVKVDMN